MPRARGSAAQARCKKPNNLGEPFRILWTSATRYLPSRRQRLISSPRWEQMQLLMNSPEYCTRIHGDHLHTFSPSREWYSTIMETKSHDVFVIERKDRVAICLSLLLAAKNGYTVLGENLVKSKFLVTIDQYYNIQSRIEYYLRYYPTIGEVVTYETLPTSHFNDTIEHGNQHSDRYYNTIINLDECMVYIQDILEFYKKDWDNKILSLNPAWEF